MAFMKLQLEAEGSCAGQCQVWVRLRPLWSEEWIWGREAQSGGPRMSVVGLGVRLD